MSDKKVTCSVWVYYGEGTLGPLGSISPARDIALTIIINHIPRSENGTPAGPLESGIWSWVHGGWIGFEKGFMIWLRLK